jgi:hypothetical protein
MVESLCSERIAYRRYMPFPGGPEPWVSDWCSAKATVQSLGITTAAGALDAQIIFRGDQRFENGQPSAGRFVDCSGKKIAGCLFPRRYVPDLMLVAEDEAHLHFDKAQARIFGSRISR